MQGRPDERRKLEKAGSYECLTGCETNSNEHLSQKMQRVFAVSAQLTADCTKEVCSMTNTQRLSTNILKVAERAHIDPLQLALMVISNGHADKHLISMLREDGTQYHSVQEAVADVSNG